MLSGQFPSLIPYINASLPHIPIPAIQHALAGRQKLRQVCTSTTHPPLKKIKKSRISHQL